MANHEDRKSGGATRPADPTSDLSKAYEEGKHRRYELLFAVNGGAFAVARLLPSCAASDRLIANLHVWQVSAGMAVLTTVLTGDIFAFGFKMRGKDTALFGWQGWLVLFVIGLLLDAGWVEISFRGLERIAYLAVYVLFVAAVSLRTVFPRRARNRP
jgi:hypothetical protein